MKKMKKLLAMMLVICMTAGSYLPVSATETEADAGGGTQQEVTENADVPSEADESAADTVNSGTDSEEIQQTDNGISTLAIGDPSSEAEGTLYQKVALNGGASDGRTLTEDGDYLMIFQSGGRYYAMTSVHDGSQGTVEVTNPNDEEDVLDTPSTGRMLTADVTDYVYDNGESIVISDEDLISRAEWQITYNPYSGYEGYYDIHGNGNGNDIREGYLRITWYSLYLSEMDFNKLTIDADGKIHRERTANTGDYYLSNYSYEKTYDWWDPAHLNPHLSFSEETDVVTGLGKGSGLGSSDVGDGVSESNAASHATQFTFYKRYDPPVPTYDITAQFIIEGVNNNQPINAYTSTYPDVESSVGVSIPAVIQENMTLVSFDAGGTGAVNNNGILTNISATGAVTFTYRLNDAYSMNTNEDGVLTQKTITDNGDGTYGLALKVQGTPTTTTSTERKPVDIVMVFDVSGSMGYTDGTRSTRLAEAKTAAISFAESLLSDTETGHRISIVRFSTGYQAYNYTSGWQGTTSAGRQATISGNNYFSGNINTVRNVINSLQADGGTNSEGGFDGAKQVLQTARSSSEAVRAVIYLTDGVPTYSLNSTSSGSSTSNTEFNAAVNKAWSIKTEGLADQIFTIGLIRGYAVNDSEYVTCDRLLSDDYRYYYNASDSSIENNWNLANSSNWSTETPAYADREYLITQGDASNTSSLLEQIYQDIQSSITVTIAGTITDTIPADFELTEESRTALESAYGSNITITENDDGTTKIEIRDVQAGAVASVIPTYNVKPRQDRYGVAYTNKGTKYEYTTETDEGDEVDMEIAFNDPLAAIAPTANPDAYYTKANSAVTVNPLSNDGKFTKLQDGGFTVGDLVITLYSDENCTTPLTNVEDQFTVTQNNNGTITFTPLTTGQFTFYYKTTATVTGPEGTKLVNGTEMTAAEYYSIPAELSSDATKVDIFAYQTSDKAYVLDYGLPVTIPESDLTAGDVTDIENDGAATAFNDFEDTTGEFGTLTKGDGSFTYTPEKYMDGVDSFDAGITVTEDNDINPSEGYSSVDLTKTIKFVPANVIYYEDTFGSNSNSVTDGNTQNQSGFGIYFSGSWTQNTAASSGDGSQDYAQDTQYGYDSEYAGDLQDSNGTSVSSSELGATASFDFTGTGFDLMARTDSTTGMVTVEVWDKNEVPDENYGNDNRKTIKLVNTVYSDGTLYQIPVINFDLGTRSTYHVRITVSPLFTETELQTGNLFIDGIRIYNPLADDVAEQYYQTGEYQASVEEVRKMILEDQTAAFVNAEDTDDITVANSDIFADIEGQSGTITDYLQYGPNNEAYLKKNQGVAFYVQLNEGVAAADATLQIGAKSPEGQAANLVFNDSQAEQVIGTATEMYYKIDLTKLTQTDDGKYLVVIANTSDNILALTNLKTKGITLTADITKDFAVDISDTGVFEPEYNPDLAIYSATSLSFVKGGDTATAYVTTDNNAAGVAVFDAEGNPMEVTKLSKVNLFGQSIWTVKFETNTVDRLSRVSYQVKSYDADGHLSEASDNIVITVRK